MRCFILGFACGIGLLQWQPALPARDFQIACAALALVSALVALLLSRWNPDRRLGRTLRRALRLALACASGAAIGFVYADVAAERRMADELPPRFEGVDIAITGIVSGLPTVNPSDRSVRFAFDVERIVTPEAVVPSRLSLAWFSGWRGSRTSSASPRERADRPEADEAPPEVHAGERWQVTVRLRRPHGNVNPHGYDLEAWMLENGLRATGYIRKDDANRRIDAFSGRPIDAVDALRERIRARMRAALGDRPYAGVLVALTIGDQRSVPQDQWLLYNRTGVSHLLSISGLHVTLFATLMGGAVFWLWRRSHRLTTLLPARKAAAALGAFAAFGYVLLAGFEVPAQRTLYMLCIAAAGLWLGRPGTAFTVLLWALLVVLLLDPWAVLAPGFWLSFGAVALLMYISVGRIHGAGAHWLITAAEAQWAITVGMVPMMLALFQQVSLIAPIANAFAIPVVSLVIVPMALAWLVLPLDIILIAAHQLFAWVVAGLQWLNEMPAAVWSQHAPSGWAIVAGVVGVLLLLAPRGLHARALGAVWLAPLFIAVPIRPEAGAFWMEVLDVGQGLAVVVQTRQHTLLYDTGPRFNEVSDAGNRIIAPYLRAQGIAKLDGIVVTHADADHSGGALSLLATVPADWVASSMGESTQLVRAQASAGRIHVPCFAGQGWSWDGVRFDMLHPAGASYLDPKVRTNDRGCVLRISSPHGAALLTADIEARSESLLVATQRAALPADVMLVPHHGSKTSSTAPFVEAVGPRLAIATSGYRNRLGHPRHEVVAQYASRGIRLLRSDYDGAIEVRFEGGPPKARAWREVDRRYWRDQPRRGELLALE